jgi:hypothetical protein
MAIHKCIRKDLERKSVNIYRSEKYIPQKCRREKRSASFIYNTIFCKFYGLEDTSVNLRNIS